MRSVVLVGNPNVGKSVIFGIMTGRYVNVSNYPGTTVEITQGLAGINGKKTTVIDTPGTNSILPMSEDEQVTRDILLEESDCVVLQVIDARNLRRGLALAAQLAETGIPFAMDLNMIDEAASRGIQVDAQAVSETFGVPVVPTVAVRKQGTSCLGEVVEDARPSTFRMRYSAEIEDALEKTEARLPPTNIGRRALALMLLCGDDSLSVWKAENLDGEIQSEIDKIRFDLEKSMPESLSFVVSRQRLAAVDAVVDRVVARVQGDGGRWSRLIGDVSMHPLWGVPILLTVLYLTYLFVGVLGAGHAVDFLEGTVFQQYISPAVAWFVRAIAPDGVVENFLVGPPGTGVGEGPGFLTGEYGLVSMALSYSIAIVLPIVGFFFVVFSVMEDSGYLPRLATMVNRLFRLFGLNGKAVLPMVLGLGCNTMATMTARIMATKKERLIVTLLLALGVPCSAQMGVILGMLGSLSVTAVLWWLGTVVLVMLLVGYLGNKIFRGATSGFVLEVPPIRRPQLKNIAVKTVARIKWYLKEAVPLFILGTFMLYVLDRTNALRWLERAGAPLVQGLLELPAKATEAFIIGFLRRDYGAAGLYDLSRQGMLDEIQIVVSLITITLFVPCIANVFVIAKERGPKTAVAMLAFLFPFAFLVGGIVNFILRSIG